MRKADLSLIIRQQWAVRDRGVSMRVCTREGALQSKSFAIALSKDTIKQKFDKETTKVFQFNIVVSSGQFES